ncbi:hypothetical protein BJV74DRAFT_799729 [Russula compacta]|nr:hypothetical protein BJV74DRAFT_799729 [Russula compacta]
MLLLAHHRKEQNQCMKEEGGMIIFDPTLTSKDKIDKCFRVFMNPERNAARPAQHFINHRTRERHQTVRVYTDGACFNNGKANMRCGAGMWFSPKTPGTSQYMSQETYSQIKGADYALVNLGRPRLEKGKECRTIPNSSLPDQMMIGPNHFHLGKRPQRTHGNEESDRLVKKGAEKPTPDTLDLGVPDEFNIQGAKLKTMSQALAYRGIMEHRRRPICESSNANISEASRVIGVINSTYEAAKTIWMDLKKLALRYRVQQFLFKVMHNAFLIGNIWNAMQGHQDRARCTACNDIESMAHILLNCHASPTEVIWNLARQVWPHNHRNG